MSDLKKTVLHGCHESCGGKMTEFAGFDMPIQYTSIIDEHLNTRHKAGLFDVSHMGRFLVSGGDALAFLQSVLTNDAEALGPGQCQYTIIPKEDGSAIDDAYLNKVGRQDYILVVNAANKCEDLEWLKSHLPGFSDVTLDDISEQVAMIALQGPSSTSILENILQQLGNGGQLPEARRNSLSAVDFQEGKLWITRTGYTGEPVCYELFPEREHAVQLWDNILDLKGEYGVKPVGLGARDTLRLEASMPLYGHELGIDINGEPIPIFAMHLSRGVVSFEKHKGDYLGREALLKQRDEGVQRVIRSLAIVKDELTGPGKKPPRHEDKVYVDGRQVGYVTSGTTVPCWTFGRDGTPTEETMNRPIALAYIDSNLAPYNPAERPWQVFKVEDARGKSSKALVVSRNLKADTSYARPVIHPVRPRTF